MLRIEFRVALKMIVFVASIVTAVLIPIRVLLILILHIKPLSNPELLLIDTQRRIPPFQNAQIRETIRIQHLEKLLRTSKLLPIREGAVLEGESRQ